MPKDAVAASDSAVGVAGLTLKSVGTLKLLEAVA